MKIIVCLLVWLMLITGCSVDKNNEVIEELVLEINLINVDSEIEINKLQEEANKNNYEIANLEFDPNEISMLTEIHNGQSALLSYNEFNKLINRSDKPIFSKEEAIEDVNVLFKAIKYGYSLYNKYGEEFFNDLEEEVINDLTNESYKKEDFLGVILLHLSEIVDNHFFIDHNALGTLSLENKNYYYCKEYEFALDENGYYLLDEEDNKYYYESCLNNENATLMPTLTSDGYIKYSLTLLENQNVIDEKDTLLLVGSNDLTIEKEFKWLISSTCHNESREVSYEWCNDILYICVPSFYNLSEASYNTYMESAREALKAQAIIIDYRGNGGGSHSSTQDWIKTYSGIDPGQPGQMYHKLSLLNDNNQYKYILNNDERYYCNYIENKTPIFVLADKGCVSATEGSLDLLKRVENVLLVGTNTNGGRISGGSREILLPNSGISVMIPTDMDLRCEGQEKEAVGLIPDIFCDSCDAFNYLCTYLKVHGYMDNVSLWEEGNKSYSKTIEKRLDSLVVPNLTLGFYEHTIIPNNGSNFGNVVDDVLIVKVDGKEIEDEYSVYFSNELVKYEIDGSNLRVIIPNSEKQTDLEITYKGNRYLFTIINR